MIDVEHRLIAARFIECAVAGLRGTKLIDCVKSKYPEATSEAIKRAAFFAVTRPDVDKQAVPDIHEVGVLLRQWSMNSA